MGGGGGGDDQPNDSGGKRHLDARWTGTG